MGLMFLGLQKQEVLCAKQVTVTCEQQLKQSIASEAAKDFLRLLYICIKKRRDVLWKGRTARFFFRI